MSQAQSETQFGKKRGGLYNQSLTPIQDGAGIFEQGFGQIRTIFDDFKDQLGSIPGLGQVTDVLLDNAVVNEIMGLFDFAADISEIVRNVAEYIEPFTGPILQEALSEMGLNVENQMSGEELRQFESELTQGGGRAQLATSGGSGYSAALDYSAPAQYVALSPGISAVQAGLATR